MKCLNPDCDCGIGLVAYRRGWFDNRRYCSKRCRDAFVADAPNLQPKRQIVIAFVAFIGLVIPATFAMAVRAAPPPRPESPYLPGCDRKLVDATASVAAMQAKIKNLSGANKSEICMVTRLYFFEVVQARAVTALCKNGAERDRDLGRFDADVAYANEAIAARCL
jgi:hypothetical protein